MCILRRSSVPVVMIIVCLCISACSGTQATASSTEASEQTNRTTVTKPTINPQALTLGGDLNAFDKKYGPEFRGSYNAALYRNIQYQLSLLVVTDGKKGEQDTSHDRVISIDTYPLVAYQDWDLKTVQHLCDAFMPPDSRYVEDLKGPLKGEVLHIYYSQLLANTLPSSDFVISSGNLSIKGRSVTPGLFTVGYNNFFTVSPSQFIECGLGAGIDYLAVG